MNREEITRRLDLALGEADSIAEAPLLREIIDRYLRRPASLLRPRLLLRSAEAYGGESVSDREQGEGLRRLAAATELLHVFALIHDDQVDGAVRPGVELPPQPGVGAFLLLAGDLLHTVATGMIHDTVTEYRLDPAINRWVRTVALHTIAGQALDVSLLRRGALPASADLYRLYDLKTGFYSFVAPLVIGALAAGAGENDAETLKTVGLNLGRAYQLRDDLEDSRRILRCHDTSRRPWELNLLAVLLGEHGKQRAAEELKNGALPESVESAKLLNAEVPPRIERFLAAAREGTARLALPEERREHLAAALAEIAGL